MSQQDRLKFWLTTAGFWPSQEQAQELPADHKREVIREAIDSLDAEALTATMWVAVALTLPASSAAEAKASDARETARATVLVAACQATMTGAQA